MDVFIFIDNEHAEKMQTRITLEIQSLEEILLQYKKEFEEAKNWPEETLPGRMLKNASLDVLRFRMESIEEIIGYKKGVLRDLEDALKAFKKKDSDS